MVKSNKLAFAKNICCYLVRNRTKWGKMETELKRYTVDRIACNHVYDQLIAQNRLTSSLLYVFIVFEMHDFKLPLTCLIKEIGLPKQTVTSIVNRLSREEKIVTFPDPTDKRSKILYLKAAQALGIEKLRLLNDLNEEMLANLKGQVEDK